VPQTSWRFAISGVRPRAAGLAAKTWNANAAVVTPVVERGTLYRHVTPPHTVHDDLLERGGRVDVIPARVVEELEHEAVGVVDDEQ
jgi:hypothetical protein